jgi:hypothetical protein
LPSVMAGKYRKIDTRIWNDAKFSRLSDNGKLAFLFLLTHPHLTGLGAMRATIPGLAAELGWSAKAFGEAFGECSRKGLAVHNPEACFVSVPNFIKYNEPESPNVVMSWDKLVDLIPECNEKVVLFKQVTDYIGTRKQAYVEALPEAFTKAFGEHSLNQGTTNNEQEQQIPPVVPQGGRAPKKRPAAFKEFYEAYPKRSKPDQALKAWKNAGAKIKVEHDLDTAGAIAHMLEAAKAFAESDLGKSKYCPHPATWLNAGQYDDDRASWNRPEDQTKPNGKDYSLNDFIDGDA